MNCLKTEAPKQDVIEKRVKTYNTVTSPMVCDFCSKPSHKIYLCFKFKAADVNARQDFVKSHKLCYNCLNKGHSTKQCTLNLRCKTCNKRHHTLLHQMTRPNNARAQSPSSQKQNSAPMQESQTSAKTRAEDFCSYAGNTIFLRARKNYFSSNDHPPLCEITWHCGGSASLS